MSHYFAAEPKTPHRRGEVVARLRGRTFRFITDAGVFSARGVDRGTRLLIETMPVGARDVVLDLGCGYGPVGLVAATMAKDGHVHLMDINERAVELARENAARNKVTNVTLYRADGREAALMGVRFDLVLTNPPIRAGRAVVLVLFGAVREALRPGGRFLFVVRTGQGAQTLARYAAGLFGNAAEHAKGGGFRVFSSTKSADDDV